MACVIAGWTATEIIGLLETAYVAEQAIKDVQSGISDVTHAYNKR